MDEVRKKAKSAGEGDDRRRVGPGEHMTTVCQDYYARPWDVRHLHLSLKPIKCHPPSHQPTYLRMPLIIPSEQTHVASDHTAINSV